MTFRNRLASWLDALQKLKEPQALRLAVIVWVVYAIVVGGIVAAQPDKRTVTPEYRQASEKWWSSQPHVYTQKNGFLYLPQAAIFYTPFCLLPKPIGEPLWRFVTLGSLAVALWWASKKLVGEKNSRLFLVSTLLVLPSSFASARNGQVNMLLAATYLLTALSISDKKWWLAAVFFALSLAAKPISLAPILLAVVAFPRLIWPMVVCTLLLMALPFAHPDIIYVKGQYRDFVNCCLLNGGRPTGHTWCDLAGMLRTFGWETQLESMWIVRAGAALLTLGLALRGASRTDPTRAALSVLLVGAIYLMLFNPRTETNSYVILATFVALAGAYEVCFRRSVISSTVFVGLAVILGSENYGWPIFPLTNLWLKAFCTLCLLAWVAPAMIRNREPQPFLPDGSVPV